MNSKDPMYPPMTVPSCDELSHALYICIPENRSTVSIDDSTNDIPLLTAIKIRIDIRIGKFGEYY